MLSYGLYTCAALLMHTVFPFCHMYLLVYLSYMYVLTPHTLTGICYMYKNPIQQIHSHLHKWVPFHVECLFLYGCLLSDFMVFLLLTLSPHTHTLTLIAHHILTSSHPNLPPPPLLIPSPPHPLPSSSAYSFTLTPSPSHLLTPSPLIPSPPHPLAPSLLIPSPLHPLPSSSPPLLIYLLLHPSSPPLLISSPPHLLTPSPLIPSPLHPLPFSSAYSFTPHPLPSSSACSFAPHPLTSSSPPLPTPHRMHHSIPPCLAQPWRM